MAAFKPKLAQIKVIHQDDTKLVVDYHPITYLLAGTTMALLCFWAGFRYAGDPDNPGWIAFVFGLLFFAGFGLLFYRRMTLTFDRTKGQITHYKRTLLLRRRTETYPLDAFTGVALETTSSNEGKLVFQRGVMQFSDRDAIPVTTALITGHSPARVVDAINTWAGTTGTY